MHIELWRMFCASCFWCLVSKLLSRRSSTNNHYEKHIVQSLCSLWMFSGNINYQDCAKEEIVCDPWANVSDRDFNSRCNVANVTGLAHFTQLKVAQCVSNNTDVEPPVMWCTIQIEKILWKEAKILLKPRQQWNETDQFLTYTRRFVGAVF